MFFFFKQKTAYEIRLSLVGSEMCIRDREGTGRPGQVYDFYSPYWRVRFADNDWEELTASEMKRFKD